jgi:hypothetical protein
MPATIEPKPGAAPTGPRDPRTLRQLDDDDLVTAREAAELLRTSTNVLSLWAKRGKGPRILTTSDHMGFSVSFTRYRMGDLRAWIDKHTFDPATGPADKGVAA